MLQKRLNKQKDWEEWIDAVYYVALAKGIWEFIDPDIDNKPKLVEPVYNAPANGDEIQCMVANTIWTHKYDEYSTQKSELKKAAAWIMPTLSEHFASYISKGEKDAAVILQTLKKHASDTTRQRQNREEQTFKRLCKGPNTSGIHKWATECLTMINRMKQLEMEEFTDERLVRGFLKAISIADPAYAIVKTIQISDNLDDGGKLPGFLRPAGGNDCTMPSDTIQLDFQHSTSTNPGF